MAEADARHPQRAVIGTDSQYGNNVVPQLGADPAGMVPQHFTGYLHERGLAYGQNHNRDFIDLLAARRTIVRVAHDGIHNRIQGQTPAVAQQRLTQRVNQRGGGAGSAPFGTWEEAHRLMTQHGIPTTRPIACSALDANRGPETGQFPPDPHDQTNRFPTRLPSYPQANLLRRTKKFSHKAKVVQNLKPL